MVIVPPPSSESLGESPHVEGVQFSELGFSAMEAVVKTATNASAATRHVGDDERPTYWHPNKILDIVNFPW